MCYECNCLDESEDYPPEDYVKPGSESLLFVNAYEVTRHFGGKEEGGWWYNQYSPVASIPVKATSVEGHGSECYTCSMARLNHINQDTNEPYTLCKYGYHLIPNSNVEFFKQHLEDIFGENRRGDIYSVLGGVDIEIVVEDHPAEFYPSHKPTYE